MFNKKLITMVIVSIFVVMTIQANDEIKLYSQAGYPYKNLIHKAKSVNILFTEKEKRISCWVNVKLEKQEATSERITITKEAFDEAPFVNCLPRTEAKKFLAFAYL